MADDGNAPDGAQQSLTRVHWQRLRRVYRSAGWPYLDPIELDLLAAGLLERCEGADTVRLTEAGMEALAQQRKSNQNAYNAQIATGIIGYMDRFTELDTYECDNINFDGKNW